MEFKKNKGPDNQSGPFYVNDEKIRLYNRQSFLQPLKTYKQMH